MRKMNPMAPRAAGCYRKQRKLPWGERCSDAAMAGNVFHRLAARLPGPSPLRNHRDWSDMSAILYDLSRLTTRVLNPTPNGIDWIDRLYADHFLDDGNTPTYPLLFGPFGPRLFAPGALPNPTAALARQWDAPAALPDVLVEELLQPVVPGRASVRLDLQRPGRPRRIAGALGAYGLKFGANPRFASPKRAVYINATHYPLEFPRHVAWLEDRPDVKPVFYIHDLLPTTAPQAFWRGEPEKHARRLDLLARRGAGAIVSSRETEAELDSHMRGLGRTDLPILRAQPPVAAIFREPCPPDPRVVAKPFFVVCGTIEPRKNHLMLVDVWRRLVATYGPSAPKLVVVGKRGWRCEPIVAALADPALGGAVIEVAGLSNGGWRALIASARALLAPSLAEGYGLPLAEALASGVPALASDIAPFRELSGEAAVFLDPLRPEEWVEHVTRLVDGDPGAVERATTYQTPSPDTYFRELDLFIRNSCG